jgi:hypothetical protein
MSASATMAMTPLNEIVTHIVDVTKGRENNTTPQRATSQIEHCFVIYF